MEKPVSNNPSSLQRRKKELNVIYFVDSNQTRSFKVSMGALKGILIAFIGVIGWAFVSPFLLTSQVYRTVELEGEVSNALGHLFDYQTKIEDVYEKAYPDSSAPTPPSSRDFPVTAGKAGDANKNNTPKVSDLDPKTKVSAASTKSPKETKPAVITQGLAAKKAPTEPAPRPDDISVRIEDPRLNYEGKKLWLKFAIRNNDSPHRADGLVYGIAHFKATDGRDLYIGSPVAIQANNKGEPDLPEQSFRFSIRYYKAKKVSFLAPEGVAGKFEGVKLVIQNDSGKESKFGFKVSDKLKSKMTNLANLNTVAPEPDQQSPDAESENEVEGESPSDTVQQNEENSPTSPSDQGARQSTNDPTSLAGKDSQASNGER